MTHHTPSPASPAGSRIAINLSLTHGVTADTTILTCAGETPAHALQAGDRVITRDRGALPLRTLVTRTPISPQRVVRIPAHTFGQGRPAVDVDLLPDQPVVIRDWRALVLYGRTEARVAASRLVDGTIVTEGIGAPRPMVSLHFATPSVIYGNGLEMMSAGLTLGRSPYDDGALSI